MQLIPEHAHVSVNEMQDGDIAVITEWPYDDIDLPYIGRLVLRFGNDLLTLGQSKKSEKHFTGFFNSPISEKEIYQVIILNKGDIYKVQI